MSDKAKQDQMACLYAGLLLHDDSIPINEKNIKTVLEAAGCNVEPYWPSIFADYMSKADLAALVRGGSTVGGATQEAVTGGNTETTEAKEDKKEEKKKDESESAGGGFGDMFGGSDED
eukprot:gene8727-675_t